MAGSTSKAYTSDKYFDRMNELERKLDRMDGQITEIYNTIVGNKELDQDGLISRIKKLEGKTDKLNDLKNKLIGAFMVGGIAWTVLWEMIKKVFTH